MAGVTITIEGKDEALARLKNGLDQLARPRGLFDLIGAALVTSTRKRFEEGKGPDGNPWPPSWRTLNEGGRVLVDTARLANSITHEATDSQVAIGTNVLYAAIHQFGGTIRPKNGEALHFKLGERDIFAESVVIPARPFLGFDRDDDAILTGVVESCLAKVLGETGKSG